MRHLLRANLPRSSQGNPAHASRIPGPYIACGRCSARSAPNHLHRIGQGRNSKRQQNQKDSSHVVDDRVGADGNVWHTCYFARHLARGCPSFKNTAHRAGPDVTLSLVSCPWASRTVRGLKGFDTVFKAPGRYGPRRTAGWPARSADQRRPAFRRWP